MKEFLKCCTKKDTAIGPNVGNLFFTILVW